MVTGVVRITMNNIYSAQILLLTELKCSGLHIFLYKGKNPCYTALWQQYKFLQLRPINQNRIQINFPWWWNSLAEINLMENNERATHQAHHHTIALSTKYD